ncbi:MAG: two-component system, OmpR family, sensor kinase [Verrucomicrobiota bacterium]
MFFHSIRWRLQLWHGLLLVLVLAGFGITAYQLQRANQFRRIDQQLLQRTSILANILRRQSEPFGQRRPDRLRPDGPPDEGGFGPPPPERPPPGERLSGLNPGPGEPPPLPRELHLSAQDLRFFDGDASKSFYYVVWFRDGTILSRSAAAPAEVSRPARAPESGGARIRGAAREVFHYTPPGECILVGCDITPELAELRRLAGFLLGAGGGVLLFGLAGGWWLSTRAIRPIRDISATAARIATGDFSQRIPAADTDSELGQLAGVLNSTFARLEAAFEQQARFTSDAAHELRTPVSVMLTQTQGVLTKERPAAEYRETVEACQRAAQRMRRLIESLLELARLDARQESMKRGQVDLAQTAGDCIALLGPLAAERRIAIHADLPATGCQGDADRLGQVITNLLTNAIHYNQEGGEVRVVARQENGEATLTVSDTGPGISEAELPHLFERFWRADKSRTGASGRTGLGLAIAKSIVDAHAGSIEVKSEPGKGSSFVVRIPACDHPEC